MGRSIQGVLHVLLMLPALALLSCDGKARDPRIVVVVDGDIMLDTVRVRLFAPDGQEAVSDYEFTIDANAKRGEHALPLSFELEPEDARAETWFRLVVTGYRMGEVRVEQQAINTFDRGKARRLEIFLVAACDQKFCDSPTLDVPSDRHCSPIKGVCAEVERGAELPVADESDPLAGYGHKLPPKPIGFLEPVPDPFPVLCKLCTMQDDYSCRTSSASGIAEYTCRGQYADWHMPDPLRSAAYRADYRSTATGALRDQTTQLVWQREAVAEYPGCADAARPTDGSCTTEQARDYCSRLSLAERSWRLPSAIELQSLFQGSHAPPFIDRLGFPMTPAARFLTSSPDLSAAGKAYLALDFGSEQAGAYVRCVSGPDQDPRGTPDHLMASYRDDEGRVLDTKTDLDWRMASDNELHSFREAIDLCAGLLLGHRLPALNELMTLVDYTRTDPAISLANFPDTPSEPFWSASAIDAAATQAWLVDFRDGKPRLADASERHLVRCVRIKSWFAYE